MAAGYSAARRWRREGQVPGGVKGKCCRSTPRCADCPAAALLAARVRRQESEQALLVAEVFTGRPPRQLPESIELALAALRPAR